MKPTVIVATLALVGLWAGSAAAQTSQARSRARVVISEQDLRDLQRLTGLTVTGDVARDLARGLADMAEGLGGLAGQVGGSRDFRAEQSDRQMKTLAIGTDGALELKNVVGDITVKAGAGRDAKVEIVRVARGRTEADAKQGLADVTAEVTERSGRASITTHYPSSHGERPAYAVSVSYIVEAPAGTSLTIGTVSGDVRVTGIKGETTVDAVSGDIEVSAAGRVPTLKSVSGDLTLTDINSDGTMEIGTISGDIRLQNVKARRLSANVVSGDVTARDVQTQAADIKGVSMDLEYTGEIAKGGRYEFQTHSGSVNVVVTGGSGFDLQARTFSGQIDADAALGLKTTSTGRNALRGTVGDGGADVVITTFSGGVTIKRRAGR